MVSKDSGIIPFEWIIDNGSGKDYEAEARARIRRQAMKRAGAARKKRGNWGKHNLWQEPATLVPGENVAKKDSLPHEEQNPHRSRTRARSSMKLIPPPKSSTTQIMSDLGIDVFGFSLIMNQIHIGRVAKQMLSRDPKHLLRMFREQKGLPFSDERSHGTQSRFLRDAVECLSLQVYQLVDPLVLVADEIILCKYNTALKGLRAEAYGKDAWSSVDVLHAAEALSLFEILRRSNEDDDGNAWAQHVAGAARLIELRGPGNFQSDLEKSLLVSAASSIVCECLRKNEACFLERPEWQSLYQSMVVPGKYHSFRSEASIRLWSLYIRMPGLFRQVSELVCHQKTVSQADLQHILVAAHSFHREVAECRAEFERVPTFLIDGQTSEVIDQVLDSLWAMLGTSIALSIIGDRLLGALCHEKADMLEEDALLYAKQLQGLCIDASSSNPWAGLFLEQKRIAAAESVLQTSQIWAHSNRGTRGIIEKWRFEAWCHAIPRTTCCEEQSLQSDHSL